ncbi:exonuclease SbcCD subunit D C-terminal domain-containing protein [Marinomonas ostreistagni]|uniref:exonuclease SbcCD subunit D C-terminal domain-containing protein n=1 Tax=Marinomonas ostreistagni TaxID=359209 RepID=UPI001EF2D077|nr:exonuclease SbcCD subunit D C-terminal domain-containing protein [Marinomonas ostreistagni]
MGKSRLEEHQRFIAWLEQTVSEQQIECVILAGDVFDTSTPASYARELYHDCVIRLNKLNCQFIVVAGNHDSVSVLNESKRLLAKLSTYVVTEPAWQHPNDAIIALTDVHGELAAVVCAIPFLRPRDMVRYEAGQSGADKQLNLAEQIKRYYQQQFECAQAQAKNVPIIGTGHLTMVGGETTDSVRDIYVGTLESLPPSMLPEFDYLALGHIHKPMPIGVKHHWRYSGSPLAMSFDEANGPKSVCIFDTITREVERITVPAFRQLITLSGSRKQLLEQVEALDDQQELALWLDLTVTEDINLGPFQEQLGELCAQRNMEVVKVQRSRKTANLFAGTGETATLEDIRPEDVFERLLVEKEVEPERAKTLTQLFKELAYEQEEEV